MLFYLIILIISLRICEEKAIIIPTLLMQKLKN